MKLLTIAGFVAGLAVIILALRKLECIARVERNNRDDAHCDIDELMVETGM